MPKATILSKKMIEDNNLRDFLSSKNPCMSMDFLKHVLSIWPLKDVDVSGNYLSYVCYGAGIYDSSIVSSVCAIRPVVNYKEVASECSIVSEDDNFLYVEYGRGLSKIENSSEEFNNIDNWYRMGLLKETNDEITLFIKNDGTIEKAKKYVYSFENGKELEYVFISEKDNKNFSYSINDISFEKAREKKCVIVPIGPIKWIVDKKSNLMYPVDNGLFIAEGTNDYEHSALKDYLENGQFFIDIGVSNVATKGENSSGKMPFSKKSGEKKSLKDDILRILSGGNRIPYLVGHPGVGKTEIAKSLNRNYLAYNISTFTPDMFTGKTALLPGATRTITNGDGSLTTEAISEATTIIAKPEWYNKLIEMASRCKENEERCVLFFDEFDKLTPNMQVFMNGVVDNPRQIANLEIPDNVDIVLAGNTEEYSDASFSISGEVSSRLTKVEVVPDNIDWLIWANKNAIDPVIKAYLSMYPNKIMKDVRGSDGSIDYARSLTPRSWAQKINPELMIARKTGEYPRLDYYMDKDSQKEFGEFMEKYFSLGIEDILKGNIEDVSSFSYMNQELVFIVNSLVAMVNTEEDLCNVMAFLKKVNFSEYSELFERCWLRIHKDEEDILRLREAKAEVFSESEDFNYGK